MLAQTPTGAVDHRSWTSYEAGGASPSLEIKIVITIHRWRLKYLKATGYQPWNRPTACAAGRPELAAARMGQGKFPSSPLLE
jgi:hypothetical protein